MIDYDPTRDRIAVVRGNQSAGSDDGAVPTLHVLTEAGAAAPGFGGEIMLPLGGEDGFTQVQQVSFDLAGRVLIAGTYGGSFSDAIDVDGVQVLRFGADGTLDLSFGDEGLVRVEGFTQVDHLAVTRGGEIVAGGRAPNPDPAPADVRVLRVGDDGSSLDERRFDGRDNGVRTTA